MNKLKPCPFCGEELSPLKSSLSICKLNDETYALTHFCKGYRRNDGLGVSVLVYGDSEEEVIDRWNRRGKR